MTDELDLQKLRRATERMLQQFTGDEIRALNKHMVALVAKHAAELAQAKHELETVRIERDELMQQNRTLRELLEGGRT